jgi:hypothetical protein
MSVLSGQSIKIDSEKAILFSQTLHRAIQAVQMELDYSKSRSERGTAVLLKVPSAISFQHRFCALMNCAHEKYEQKMFLKCLYPHARLVAGIVRRLRPGFFREDFGVIRELATVTSAEIFQSDINRYHASNIRSRNLLRKMFLLRVSGKRLLRWKGRAFREQN